MAVAALLAVAASTASAGGNRNDDENGHGARGKGSLVTRPVDLQILAINDFHGALNTASTGFGGTGGVQYLATNLRNSEAAAAGHSVTVSAGDLIGATPLISALFHDEPTIEAANMFGLDINAVGNHEFDEGAAELLRMQNGGTHPVDGDRDGDGFAGAEFQFLAANVVVDDTGETIFPPYQINVYDDIKVAFIGMTLEGTPNIVTPSGVAGLTFNDEVETVNQLVPHLQAQGVSSIVVLIHEGASGAPGPGTTEDNCANGLNGALGTIVPALDPEVDVVIAGHTNHEFICFVGDTLVTMADNNGRLYTDIDLQLNRVTKDITVVAVDNVRNLRTVAPAIDLQALINKYDAISAPFANRVIGSATTLLSRAQNVAGESSLGDIIADSQLLATASTGFGNAVIAFMNPGGIRTDITTASTGGEPVGDVTYGEVFNVQPFGNSLVTMTLTGTQIDTLLEQQWLGQVSPRILQVSSGLAYTWSQSAPNGSKVDPATITLNGIPIDPAASYRVTVNSFLSDGGDNFFVLIQGTNRLGGAIDLDALEAYFVANSPVPPGPQNRITVIS
jgi:5'-nucleotidase